MAATLAFTIPEAVTMLNPAISEEALRIMIRTLRWRPDGYRRTGRTGHPVAVYEWSRITLLHGAIVPFMEER